MNQQSLPPWALVVISSSISAATVAITMMGVSVLAEDTELDATPRRVPYNGVLELNGAGYNGLADFRFTLTDDDDCNMVEEHDNVQVFNGRFSVNIGAVNGDLPGCIFDAEQVFISMAVREAEDELPHRALSGRQRINPVPFAYWAAEGSDLKVDGSLSVLGPANITGNTRIEGSTTTPEVNGLARINPGGGAFTTGGNVTVGDQLTVSGDTTLNGALSVRGAITDPNSDVTINDGLIVTGNLSNSGGDVTINDNLDITGDIQDPNSDVIINDGLIVNGNISDGNSDVIINDGLEIRGNVKVTSPNSLMRLVYNRQPPDGSGDGNSIGISTDGTICMITSVDSFNENSDRCVLSQVNNLWHYRASEGDCNVMCYSWR